MQRILVTGGLGQLGRPLLMALLNQGYTVRALRLPYEAIRPGLDTRIETVVGDVTDRDSLSGVCDGVDGVLHAAGILMSTDPSAFKRVNLGGTLNMLAESERAGIKHFMFVSSISVTYASLSPYARSKAQAEHALRASTIPEKTVVRPTLIYDDAGGAAEFARFTRYVARYPWVPLPAGGAALKRPVHAEDAANLLARLMLAPKAFGKTYALAGGEILSLHAMAMRIIAALGLKRRIVAVPGDWALRVAAVLPTARVYQGVLGLLQQAAPDIGDLQRDFEYAPRAFAPSAEALHRAAYGQHARSASRRAEHSETSRHRE